MIDPLARINTFLAAQATLTALIGTRLWAGRSVPPAGVQYKPSVGGAIVFNLAGGPVAYSGSYINPRVQFKCYAADELAAMQVYGALYDVLKRGGGNGIKSSYLETLGQPLEEPDTGWPFVLTFASFWLSAE